MPLLPISGGDVETFDKVITNQICAELFWCWDKRRSMFPPGGRIIAYQAASLLNPFRTMVPTSLPKRAWKAWSASCQ